MLPMQFWLLWTASAAFLRKPSVKTGVPATVLPTAHPQGWQACSKKCTDLDIVPHKCFQDEGDMFVHPACFAYSCELFHCLDSEQDCDLEVTEGGSVKAEIWSKVEQRGFAVQTFLDQCTAGTFTCLSECPDLHSLLVDEDAISRCGGDESTKDSRMHCLAWLQRIDTCMEEKEMCSASLFGQMPRINNATNLSTVNMTVVEADLIKMQNISKSMDAVVRSSQEAFESTFMEPCHPACERGEECLAGHCVYRPFETRVKAGGMDEVGGIHPPPPWWNDFAEERPNHPQRDHWSSGAGVSSM
jgi:hypothetical protein